MRTQYFLPSTIIVFVVITLQRNISKNGSVGGTQYVKLDNYPNYIVDSFNTDELVLRIVVHLKRCSKPD